MEKVDYTEIRTHLVDLYQEIEAGSVEVLEALCNEEKPNYHKLAQRLISTHRSVSRDYEFLQTYLKPYLKCGNTLRDYLIKSQLLNAIHALESLYANKTTINLRTDVSFPSDIPSFDYGSGEEGFDCKIVREIMLWSYDEPASYIAKTLVSLCEDETPDYKVLARDLSFAYKDTGYSIVRLQTYLKPYLKCDCVLRDHLIKGNLLNAAHELERLHIIETTGKDPDVIELPIVSWDDRETNH